MNERYYNYYLNWIKNERERQNLSLEDFSELCNYSKANVSKIVNHKAKADEKMLLAFFHALKIDFKFEVNEKYDSWLEELYKAIVFHNLDVAQDLLEKIESNKEEILHSQLFLKYYLYRYAWYTMKRKTEEIQSIQRQLNEHIFPHITQDKLERQIYLDYLGVNLCIQNKYEESIATLTEAMNLTDKSYTYGMICYHIGTSYGYIGNVVDQVHYGRIAMTAFTRDLNFKRLLFVQVHIANVYSRIHMYSIADQIYQNIFNNKEIFNNEYLIKTLQANMNSLLMRQGNYTQSIDNILNAYNESGKLSDADYFNLIFCYYKLDDYESINKWVPVFRKVKFRNPSIFKEIEVMDKIINMSSIAESISYIKKEYKQNKETCSYELRELYLQLLVDLNEKEHKYKEALYYYKKLYY